MKIILIKEFHFMKEDGAETVQFSYDNIDLSFTPFIGLFIQCKNGIGVAIKDIFYQQSSNTMYLSDSPQIFYLSKTPMGQYISKEEKFQLLQDTIMEGWHISPNSYDWTEYSEWLKTNNRI